MIQRFFASLRGRLLVLMLGLAALPALLLGGLAYQNARATIELREKARLSAVADLKRDQIVSWLADRSADARLLADNFLIEEHFTVILDPAADARQQAAFAGFLTDNLVSIQQARQGYRELLFADKTGTVILSTDPNHIGMNLAHDAAFAKALASQDGAAVYDVHWPAAGGEPEMVFGHVLRQIDLSTNSVLDQVNGVIIIRVRMDETLYPLIRDWPDRGATGETLLVRADGDATLFLNPLRFDDEAALHLRVLIDSPLAQPAHRAAAGADGIVETRDYRNVPVLAAYRAIPQTGWGLVAKQDTTEAFAPVASLTRQLALASLLVSLAAAVTAVLLARAVTRPLSQLAAATQAVAAGDYSAEIVIRRADEFGTLANSFRAMLEAVRQSHSALRARTDELQALVDLSQALLGTLDRQTMLAAAVHQAVSATGSTAGAILLTDDGGDTITIQAVSGFPAALVGQRFPIDAHTAPGYALTRREAVCSFDLAGETRFRVPPFIQALGVRANLAVPVLFGSQAIGALVVDSLTPRRFTDDEVRVVQAVANQTAMALERARLFDDLSHSYDRTLDALVAALDSRDRETEGHSQRVMAYTLALAHQMRVPEEELATIRRGALLHDIGKIGVPDAILCKPGPLTPSEWDIMRCHPEWGRHILEGIPFLAEAVRVIYTHHERWDGSGYPQGLQGEAIPLGGLIFAVADAFDAMTSDRPYRAAGAYTAARAEIELGSGSQFAPQVVEAFTQIPEADWRSLRAQSQLESAPLAAPAWPDVNPAWPALPGFETLARLIGAVSASLDLSVVLAQATRTLVEAGSAAAAVVLLYDAERDTLTLAAQHGLPDVMQARFKSLPVTGFHSESVVREACSSFEADLGSVAAFRELGLPQLRPDWGAYLCVPLTASGSVQGLLGLFSRRPGTFDQPERRLYEAVGEQIGLAIANARSHAAMQALAATDSLTGAYNRRYLGEFLAREVNRSMRYRHQLSLLMVDIDEFKTYNDTHGHLAGDEGLRQMAALLRSQVRGVDLVARFGGDEFVIVLLETDPAGANAAAEKLRAAVEAHAFAHGRLTVSVGVMSSQSVSEVDTLLAMADEALMHAKHTGRNCVWISS